MDFGTKLFLSLVNTFDAMLNISLPLLEHFRCKGICSNLYYSYKLTAICHGLFKVYMFTVLFPICGLNEIVKCGFGYYVVRKYYTMREWNSLRALSLRFEDCWTIYVKASSPIMWFSTPYEN